MSAYFLLRNLSRTSRSIMSSLTVPLNDGTQIPWLGFGTGTALFSKDAENAVLTAIASGVAHLDGAQSYGNEDSLGAAIVGSGKPRSSLYVVTKLNTVPAGQTVRDTLVTSLKKLRVDYVDLFLIHSPKNHEGKLSAVWKEVEALQKEGLAKSIGVSNFRIQDLEEILGNASVVPAVNQIEYHPYVLKASQPLLEYAKSKNILITSYGGLTPIARFPGGPIDSVLSSIAARVSETAGQTVNQGQVLQLWLRAQNIPAISTSSKESRIKEYLATETLPGLTADEVQAINEAGSKTHHRVFQKWLDD
ncbi:Aldo/keto reductase [Wolfiporia cocos MD-104 SS10]|uniref:Aldo/keto reductase n=1 Tax=Wolfiporia cocos (strain MD-104) TaxID=742152 RepID=A0A2H3J7S2_WOLCO|nr:Aldo/keto reductase [Wolfiporia cocos MD-104 SS10]